MSSFVQRFENGEIWWCIDDFFRHHEYGYIKLKNIEEWYALWKDDVDWKTRVVKEKVFHMQTKNLTRVHEEPKTVDPMSQEQRFEKNMLAASDKLKKPDAIIFDCDGVLLDCHGKPWEKNTFITPRADAVTLLWLLWRKTPASPKVIILTGRPERIRMDTVNQLLTNSIFYDELVMNDILLNGNTPPWLLFKIRKLPELMDKYNIIGMFEDDPQVIQSVRNIYPEISTYHVYD